LARLRSLLYALFLTVTVIPYAFACLLWSFLPLHQRYRLTVGWPRLAVWGARVICGIRWQVKGWENLPDGPAVLLSKHQSAWETLFFPAYMPRDLCFVYKRELHKVPFFGWGLALLRMIPIDRARGRDAFDQVVACFLRAPALRPDKPPASRWVARCLRRAPVRSSSPWQSTRANAGAAMPSSSAPG
jgi:1-acyl-sn-glycerol-3-phosphate acyltransferase